MEKDGQKEKAGTAPVEIDDKDRAILRLLQANAKITVREIAAQMYVEILWNSVTTKADKWSHQNETRLLAVNNRKDPQLKIVNGEVRPRVELPQPLLRPNLVEIMLGPKCEAGARDRIRKVLDDLGLGSVTISSAAPP